VTVLVTETKAFTDTVKGISSFNLESGVPDKYPYDYKIISKLNYRKNSNDYYLIPYTIFELKEVLTKYVDNAEQMLNRLTTDNISVKTSYNYSNVIYDNQHGFETQTNEVMYILEKNNQLLIKTDPMKGTEIKRYCLMSPEASGSNYKSIVYPSGMTRHRELREGYEYYTDYFQGNNNVIKPEYITCLNKEGALKWIPSNIDMHPSSGYQYRDLRGMLIFDGYLYTMVVDKIDDSSAYNRMLNDGYKTQLIKIDLDDEDNITKIYSGRIIEINNPASMTVNKDNKLIIASYSTNASGNHYIQEYNICYDYTLIDKNEDNTNRIYFREQYPLGVNI
jgi:hypothetical protein